MDTDTDREPTAEEIERVQRHLAKRECATFGHDTETVITFAGLEPRQLICTRCGRSWPVGPGVGGAE